MNFQYAIENIYDSRKRSYSIGLNAYFGPKWTNIPHETAKYGPGKSKFEVIYYRQTYFSPEKVA